MKLLHITPAANLHSILTEGLYPSVPRLEHHREAFLQDGLPEKITYAWRVNSKQRLAKLTKDVAYWHVWGVAYK